MNKLGSKALWPQLLSKALVLAFMLPATTAFAEEPTEKVLLSQTINGDALPPKTIAFTYDDGPDEYTLAIAQFLYNKGIKATFFVNGCRLKNSPPPAEGNCTIGGPFKQYPVSVLKKLIDFGHRIANHTEDHIYLQGKNQSNVLYQIGQLQVRLDELIKDGVYLFRPPYGSWDENVAIWTGQDPALAKLVGPVGWDVGGGDWQCLPILSNTIETCGERYLTELAAREKQNGIILMHDRIEGALGSNRSLLLTQWLVAHLPRPEYRFVPLDAIPGSVFASPPLALWTLDFSNPAGWGDDIGRYGTVRLGDVNGDHRADVCGRAPDGIRCALSNGVGFAGTTAWTTSEYTDALGWAPEPYSTTIQLADLNGDGKADVCGRGAYGLRCALAKKNGRGFKPATWWSPPADFWDSEGWDGEQYFGTIRLADVNGDGKADACGRASNGIVCGLSNGSQFAPLKLWQGSDFTDAQGWGFPEYARTIQFADLNQDQRADVCGRNALGIKCALARPSGGFGPATYWTPPHGIFSDEDGWGSSPSKYESIHLADINSDMRADICGRNETGIVCALSNGLSFINYKYIVHSHYTDALGWGGDSFGTTVQFSDIDGDKKADVCGRGYNGILCAIF